MDTTKTLILSVSVLAMTSLTSAVSLTSEQAETLETISLGIMGISGVALVGLVYTKMNSESDSVSRAEAKNKLRATQSYVTNQIEMGNKLKQEDKVISDLEAAADLIDEGEVQSAMNKIEEIEEILGKEFNA